MSFSDVVQRTLRRAEGVSPSSGCVRFLTPANGRFLTLIDYSMYKYPIAELNILNDPSDARSMIQKGPSFPAGAGPAREEQPIFKPVPPHEIHDSQRGRLICGYNSASEQDRLVLEYRLLYHDMADPSFGYPVNTEIEVGKVAAGVSRGSGQKHFYMDSFTLLKIGSYNDFSFSIRRIYHGSCLRAGRGFMMRGPIKGAVFCSCSQSRRRSVAYCFEGQPC